MSDRYIEIVNWERYQNADVWKKSAGRPPWIKAYTSLLTHDSYSGLSFGARGLLLGLQLIRASAGRPFSESGARRTLVASASDSRHWKRHMDSLNDAGLIEFVSRKTRDDIATREEEKREEKKDLPPNPHRVGDVDNGTPRQRGTNPRAQGTNPRATTEADRVARHEAMVDAARRQSESWMGRTDRMHENLDRLEAEHGAIFTDQERTEIIDSVLARESVPF